MQGKVGKIEVPFIDITGLPSPKDVLAFFEDLNPTNIANNPWPKYVNSVKANFNITHNGCAIFLKFTVEENFLLAKASTNGNIHEDSCVEFFLDLDDNGKYYNLEFNCLGWGKIGYGRERDGRVMLNADVVELISSSATINSTPNYSTKLFSWNIILVIPTAVFCYSDIKSLTGIKAKGNLYKCGDSIPSPHYLVWNPINSEEPDFHRPEYFGELEFCIKPTKEIKNSIRFAL